MTAANDSRRPLPSNSSSTTTSGDGYYAVPIEVEAEGNRKERHQQNIKTSQSDYTMIPSPNFCEEEYDDDFQKEKTSTITQKEDLAGDFRSILCWGMILICFPIVLISLTGKEETLILHPGASRQVSSSPVFTRSIHVKGDKPPLIYSINGDCPSLDGPVLTQEYIYEKEIEERTYAYNQYFLNPGSVIDIQVTAQLGGAKIYLFRGKQSFNAWVRDPGEFKDHPIMRNHTYIGNPSAQLRYTCIQANEFYVVYENVFNQQSHLTSIVRRTLTTYSLAPQHVHIPYSWCTPDRLECFIPLEEWRPVCVVIQAAPVSTGVGKVGTNQNNAVTVDVIDNRRWSVIVMICAVPILLMYLYMRLSQSVESTKDINDRIDAEEADHYEYDRKHKKRHKNNHLKRVLSSEFWQLQAPETESDKSHLRQSSKATYATM